MGNFISKVKIAILLLHFILFFLEFRSFHWVVAYQGSSSFKLDLKTRKEIKISNLVFSFDKDNENEGKEKERLQLKKKKKKLSKPISSIVAS